MIQVLGLRERIDQRTGRPYKTHAFFQKNWRFSSIQDVFDAQKLDTLLDHVPATERFNLYFTVADCFEEKARQLKEQWAIPFDIDDLVFTNEDTVISEATAVAQAACEALGVDYTKVGVIFSGNGVQIFIPITYAIRSNEYFDQGREHYKAVCDQVQAHLRKLNLSGKLDTSVWSESRLMRLPHTENRKPGKHTRKAQILNGNLIPLDYDLFQKSGLQKFTEAETVPAAVLRTYPPPDTPAVLDGCEFLKWSTANQAKVNEPQWYAKISIEARLEKGRELVHDHSAGHPGYNFEETELKIDQALRTSGPRTCKDIESRWNGCPNCKHYNKCSSPIMIRGENYISSENFGFRKQVMGKDGSVKPGRPDFQDLVKYFRQIYQYIALESGLVYVYAATHWRPMKDAYINEWTMQTIKPAPSSGEVAEFLAILKMFNVKSFDALSAQSEGKLNFRNCVLDMQSGDVTMHSPEYGFLNVLPFDYDPQATAPRWEQYLHEVTGGDEELVLCLKEFGGYSISGDKCWVQKALLLLGSGANGKSIYADTLRYLVGEQNYSAVMMQDMGKEYYRYGLIGKLFNYSEETSAYALSNSDTFKALTVGGRMTAREPYGKMIEFDNRAKAILLANNPPESKDRSFGYERRFLIVPFNQVFTEDDPRRDPFLQDKINAEISGVCNSLMAAYKLAKERNKMTNPRASRESLKNLMAEGNSVVRFYDERVNIIKTFDEESPATTKDELFQAYVMFCKENSEKEFNQVWFYRESHKVLPDLEVRVSRHHGRRRVVLGVTIAKDI